MKRFIQEYLLENWSLKATAILLALILWLFVRGEPGIERVVTVPLEVQVPRHMEITNDRLTSVEVTLRGAAFSSIWLSQPLPTCIIDLQGAKEGEHVITLTPDNVKTPRGSGIEVLQVNPVRVELHLEHTISKEVPVVVPISGEPLPNFEVYGKLVKPAMLIVTGPRSKVESIREVATEPVSISGRNQSSRFYVGLNLKGKSVRASLGSPVQVDIQVGPRRELHTIAKVPVSFDTEDYTAIPSQVAVQVLAPAEIANDLSPADFHVSLASQKLNDIKLPARITPEVTLLRPADAAIIVRGVQPSEVVVHKARKK